MGSMQLQNRLKTHGQIGIVEEILGQYVEPEFERVAQPPNKIAKRGTPDYSG